MFQPDKLADLISETKADPRSLDGIIAWLGARVGATGYDHRSHTDCLICQYASDHLGRKVKFNEASEWADGAGGYAMFRKVAYPHWGSYLEASSDSTYAGALSRARAYARAAHNEAR